MGAGQVINVVQISSRQNLVVEQAEAVVRLCLRMNASDSMPEFGATYDQRFMSLALALGRRGLGNTWPNPAVGAVVVRHDGGEPVIIGRGWTQPGGGPRA